MIPGKWNGDRRFECHNSPWRIGAHFFGCLDLHALEVERVSFRCNPHNRGHTCRQSGGDKIGRRKRFTLSLVVDGSIGFQFGPRRTMSGRAVQLALVGDGNLNQNWLSPALRQGCGPIPLPCTKGT